MELLAQDFYFYHNGNYKTISKFDNHYKKVYSELEPVSHSIRIFGTKEQIEQAFNEYSENTGLNLDETYYCDDPNFIEIYKKKYEKNKQAIIVNLIY